MYQPTLRVTMSPSALRHHEVVRPELVVQRKVVDTHGVARHELHAAELRGAARGEECDGVLAGLQPCENATHRKLLVDITFLLLAPSPFSTGSIEGGKIEAKGVLPTALRGS